jgi:hypothetical protein
MSSIGTPQATAPQDLFIFLSSSFSFDCGLVRGPLFGYAIPYRGIRPLRDRKIVRIVRLRDLQLLWPRQRSLTQTCHSRYIVLLDTEDATGLARD